MKRALVLLFLLAACDTPPKRDYEAQARCHDLGYDAGSKEYANCIREEQAARQLREQREEFERMKQDQRDWRMMRDYQNF